ncbi:MAG: ABC transporter ATP-binding protein [Clostridium sp.]|nr:ABC transporter ATP-binding protein [Clostridium sp.]
MIVLKNAMKSYKGDGCETTALNDVNLEINKGEFVAVMGKSGSGKSTLLNIIGCMDKLTEGSYHLDDVDVTGLGTLGLDKIRKEKVSFIFQNYELMEHYTVYENIEIPLLAAKLSKKQRKIKIKEIMDRLSISQLSKKFPKQISGGEQQRTAIARALVAGNDYMLADEPTGALDQENSTALMNIFKDIHKNGKTIIMVTHDKDIASYADRIIEICDGKIFKE